MATELGTELGTDFVMEIEVEVPLYGDHVDDLRQGAWEGYGLNISKAEAIRYLSADPQLAVLAFCGAADDDQAQDRVIVHFWADLMGGEACPNPAYVREKMSASYGNKDEMWCNLPDSICATFFGRDNDPHWEVDEPDPDLQLDTKAMIRLNIADLRQVVRMTQSAIRLPNFGLEDAAVILRDNPSYALEVYAGRAMDTDVRSTLRNIISQLLIGKPWPLGSTSEAESAAFFEEFDLAAKACGWRPLEADV